MPRRRSSPTSSTRRCGQSNGLLQTPGTSSSNYDPETNEGALAATRLDAREESIRLIESAGERVLEALRSESRTPLRLRMPREVAAEARTTVYRMLREHAGHRVASTCSNAGGARLPAERRVCSAVSCSSRPWRSSRARPSPREGRLRHVSRSTTDGRTDRRSCRSGRPRNWSATSIATVAPASTAVWTTVSTSST